MRTINWYHTYGDVMEFTFEALGSRIAKRRVDRGIRQNELAEKVGISNNHLSGIEHGTAKPSIEVLASICNELDVTPDYLMMGVMRSNNVPKEITDGLRLCSGQDLELVRVIVEYMVERNGDQWNEENFV